MGIMAGKTHGVPLPREVSLGLLRSLRAEITAKKLKLVPHSTHAHGKNSFSVRQYAQHRFINLNFFFGTSYYFISLFFSIPMLLTHMRCIASSDIASDNASAWVFSAIHTNVCIRIYIYPLFFFAIVNIVIF